MMKLKLFFNNHKKDQNKKHKIHSKSPHNSKWKSNSFMTKHLIFWIIFYKIYFSATNRFFFLDNHREYIEKTIKPIVKLKYKDIKKRKKNRFRKKREKNWSTTTNNKETIWDFLLHYNLMPSEDLKRSFPV